MTILDNFTILIIKPSCDKSTNQLIRERIEGNNMEIIAEKKERITMEQLAFYKDGTPLDVKLEFEDEVKGKKSTILLIKNLNTDDERTATSKCLKIKMIIRKELKSNCGSLYDRKFPYTSHVHVPCEIYKKEEFFEIKKNILLFFPHLYNLIEAGTYKISTAIRKEIVEKKITHTARLKSRGAFSCCTQ